MITPIVSHNSEALKRLIGQYVDSQKFKDLISSLIVPIQEIEGVLGQLNTLRMLFVATGVQLDNIGKIVGLARFPGDGDETYRQKIFAEIKVNTSEGEPERVIETFQLFTGALLVILIEWFPAEVSVESEYLPPDQATVDLLLGIIEKVLPAGVRCDSILTFDATEAFAMEGSLPGLGFDDDSAPGSGGKFPTEFYRNTFFEFEGDDVNGAGFGSDEDPLVGGLLDNV